MGDALPRILAGDGRELPHVTAVLRDAGLISLDFVSEEARDRGSSVHAATHYLDEQDLDWSSLEDSRVRAAVQQYERFIAEARPEILACEEPVRNEVLGYCGRLDRRVRINGREGVLDIKGVCQSPWHGAQLAGYAGCFDRPLARWNLYLSADRYILVERKDRDDWKVFCAAVTLAHYRSKHGLTEPRPNAA